MKKNILILTIILLSIANCTKSQISDTLKIYYGIDVSKIDASQQATIDKFINNKTQQKELSISINGYTDYLAGDDYNKILSCKRADNVRDYLIKKGFNKKMIHTKGNGKLPPELKNNTDGVKENRKVEIVITNPLKSSVKTVKTKAVIKPIKVETETSEPEEVVDKEIKTDIKLIKEDTTELYTRKITDLEVGENLILKNVNFYPGRHYPMEEARPALENLLKVMKENPTLEIEIQGHICCVPYGHDCLDIDTHRHNLSLERSKYVCNYLIRNGINKSRLSYQGFGGKHRLIKIERTEDDRMRNRRVEIKIIKK